MTTNGDIRFQQLADSPVFRYAVELDWLMTDMSLIADGLDLQSAVIVALGTDALADVTDELPALDDTDRRGWWGDLDAQEIWGGWPVGCKLWLLARSSITDASALNGATLVKAIGYTRAAMKPFTDNRIASKIAVTGEQVNTQQIDVGVEIYRGPVADINLLYSELWDALGRR